MNAALPLQAVQALNACASPIPADAPAVTQQQFRNAMAKLPAAVHIITTDGPHGKAGITASAVCSLSDSPPTLIVCLNREARARHCAVANGRLAVNVLGEDGQELSAVFAGQRGLEMPERFGTGANWQALDSGAPVLEDAVCAFDCLIDSVQEVGSHSVLICRVLAISPLKAAPNLLYHERQYKVCPPTAASTVTSTASPKSSTTP